MTVFGTYAGAQARRSLLGVMAACGLCISAAAADEVVVGVPIPLTGPYAGDGQVMEQGIMLAIDELNASGGVLGQQLVPKIYDIGDLTPDKLQAAALELIERQNAVVLINGYGGMGPDIPAFCPYPQPYLNNNATTAVVALTERMGCTNVFMVSDVDRSYGNLTFQQINGMGYLFSSKRIAILKGPYDWEIENTDGIREAAEAAGWNVVMNEEVPYGSSQWSGTLAKLRDLSPDLIAMEIVDPTSVTTFLDQFRNAPVPGAIVYAGYLLSTPAFGELVSQGGLDGVLGMTLAANRPNEAGAAFASKWQAKYREQPPLSIGAFVYDEVMAWADAVTKAGSVTDYDAVKAELQNSSYTGVTGTISFNEKRYVPSSDETLPLQLLQAQDGRVLQLMIGSQKVNDFVKPAWVD